MYCVFPCVSPNNVVCLFCTTRLRGAASNGNAWHQHNTSGSAHGNHAKHKRTTATGGAAAGRGRLRRANRSVAFGLVVALSQRKASLRFCKGQPFAQRAKQNGALAPVGVACACRRLPPFGVQVLWVSMNARCVLHVLVRHLHSTYCFVVLSAAHISKAQVPT